MAGRKTKISKELIDEICTYKENGLSDKDVCDMVGIDQSTFCRWLKEAETGIDGNDSSKPAANLELKKELSEEIKKAKVAFKAYHIQNINKASKKNWQASAWVLERFYPKEFGRIDRQVAMIGEAEKDNGMLNEILGYLNFDSNGDG